MQVNPSPPESVKAEAKYDGSIDGVLLNGQNEVEYNAIQQQLQGNYALVPQNTERSAYPAKPLVGSEEWYKLRKDNHKAVERRRRETINRGIDELAKVVPDCDKHKGQILQRSLDYIKKLKENEQQYMEKLTLEKLMAEQVIAGLENTIKKLTAELEQAWKDIDHWKRQSKAK